MERLSLRTSGFWRDAGYDVERAQKRFMPASTFKVPHALFALDAGAVRDEFQDSVDGVKRDFDGGIRIDPALIHEALDGMGCIAVCP